MLECQKLEALRKSNSKQRTLDQTTTELVPSKVKSKNFCVRLKVSLEDKVHP
jgi:hypothetical protein